MAKLTASLTVARKACSVGVPFHLPNAPAKSPPLKYSPIAAPRLILLDWPCMLVSARVLAVLESIMRKSMVICDVLTAPPMASRTPLPLLRLVAVPSPNSVTSAMISSSASSTAEVELS